MTRRVDDARAERLAFDAQGYNDAMGLGVADLLADREDDMRALAEARKHLAERTGPIKDIVDEKLLRERDEQRARAEETEATLRASRAREEALVMALCDLADDTSIGLCWCGDPCDGFHEGECMRAVAALALTDADALALAEAREAVIEAARAVAAAYPRAYDINATVALCDAITDLDDVRGAKEPS